MSEICPVCIEPLNDKEKIHLPNCNHYFCNECIKTWLNKSESVQPTCPVCRQDFSRALMTSKILEQEKKLHLATPLNYAWGPEFWRLVHYTSTRDCRPHRTFSSLSSCGIQDREIVGVPEAQTLKIAKKPQTQFFYKKIRINKMKKQKKGR